MENKQLQLVMADLVRVVRGMVAVIKRVDTGLADYQAAVEKILEQPQYAALANDFRRAIANHQESEQAGDATSQYAQVLTMLAEIEQTLRDTAK